MRMGVQKEKTHSQRIIDGIHAFVEIGNAHIERHDHEFTDHVLAWYLSLLKQNRLWIFTDRDIDESEAIKYWEQFIIGILGLIRQRLQNPNDLKILEYAQILNFIERERNEFIFLKSNDSEIDQSFAEILRAIDTKIHTEKDISPKVALKQALIGLRLGNTIGSQKVIFDAIWKVRNTMKLSTDYKLLDTFARTAQSRAFQKLREGQLDLYLFLNLLFPAFWLTFSKVPDQKPNAKKS